jgi:hypothetical protein
VVQTEARARSFGRRHASVEVSLQPLDDRPVRFPGLANEALSDGSFVNGVCPCAQVEFERERQFYLIGLDEHDNLHNIENARGQITQKRITAADRYNNFLFNDLDALWS